MAKTLKLPLMHQNWNNKKNKIHSFDPKYVYFITMFVHEQRNYWCKSILFQMLQSDWSTCFIPDWSVLCFKFTAILLVRTLDQSEMRQSRHQFKAADTQLSHRASPQGLTKLKANL